MNFYTQSKNLLTEADEERLRRLAAAGDPEALVALAQLRARNAPSALVSVTAAVQKGVAGIAKQRGWRFRGLPSGDLEVVLPPSLFKDLPILERQGLPVIIHVADSMDGTFEIIPTPRYPAQYLHVAGSSDAVYQALPELVLRHISPIFPERLSAELPSILAELVTQLLNFDDFTETIFGDAIATGDIS